MKTPLFRWTRALRQHSAMGLWLVFVLICLYGVMLSGCSRRTGPPPQHLTPTRPTRTDQSAPASPETTAAKDVVVQYLQALYSQEYQKAHNLLSAESKQRHPLTQFSRDAAETQVMYDLDKAQVKTEGAAPGQAKVIVSMEPEEEPGSKTFTVANEQGRWRVVYLEGKPFSPYGE